MADLTFTSTDNAISPVNPSMGSVEFSQEGDLPSNKIVFMLLSPQTYSILAKCLFVLVYIIMCGGMVGNAMSVRTFLRMGLKDCMSISFFILAISDLCCIITLSMGIGYYFNDISHLDLGYYSPLNNTYSYKNTILGGDPFMVKNCLNKFLDLFFFVSSSMITFIAVQRSLCVLKPLQFKAMFTRRLTFIILSLIWGYWLIMFLLGWTYVTFEKVDHGYKAHASRTIIHVKQKSRFYIGYRKYRKTVDFIVLPSMFLIAVLGGLVILTHALMKSVRFRQTATNQGGGYSQKDASRDLTASKTAADGMDEASAKKSATAMNTSKERQAIIQVAILSALFLLSQFPAIVWSIAIAINSQLDDSDQYRYFRRFVKHSYTLMDATNASVNFLVYYKFNTRFREVAFQRKT